MLRTLFQQHLARYRGDKKAAFDFMGIGGSKWNAKLDASELLRGRCGSAILNWTRRYPE